jgi:hypothetical protein
LAFIFRFDCVCLSPAPAKRSGGYGNAGRPSVRPRYVVSALRFLFVDQLISSLHTSIILGISSISSKLGKIRKKIVRMAAIFKMSAKTHQHFKEILEHLQHISDGRTDARHFHIPRSALRGRGTNIHSQT